MKPTTNTPNPVHTASNAPSAGTCGVERLTIRLDGLRFHACHGVSEQERRVGQDFTVSLRLVVGPCPGAVGADRLEATVNYAEAYALVRSVMAVMRVEPIDAYEEASATLGASSWTTFRKVVVPVAMPGILAGALMVMTVSLGEFNISWMLQTPDTKTLPVGMADSYASMRLEVGSAYTFLFLVILVPLLSMMQALPERMRRRAEEKQREAEKEA